MQVTKAKARRHVGCHGGRDTDLAVSLAMLTAPETTGVYLLFFQEQTAEHSTYELDVAMWQEI